MSGPHVDPQSFWRIQKEVRSTEAEVIDRVERRRKWSVAKKAALLAVVLEPAGGRPAKSSASTRCTILAIAVAPSLDDRGLARPRFRHRM